MDESIRNLTLSTEQPTESTADLIEAVRVMGWNQAIDAALKEIGTPDEFDVEDVYAISVLNKLKILEKVVDRKTEI